MVYHLIHSGTWLKYVILYSLLGAKPIDKCMRSVNVNIVDNNLMQKMKQTIPSNFR